MTVISNREKVIAVLSAIETGNAQAFAYIHPERYVQHNLSMPDGLAGIASVVGAHPVGTFKANVVRAFEDGDYVFAHTEYDFFGEKVGFDVFRFENGLIVEHWDNLIEKQPNNQANRSQTDGVTEVTDRHHTERNKALVRDFVEQNWLHGRDAYDAFTRNDVYIQHNPMGADGIAAFRQVMAHFQQAGLTMRFTKVHKILGEGNFVLAMSEGLLGENGGEPTAFYDLFRVENDVIVEHWDVIEAILSREQWANANGKF